MLRESFRKSRIGLGLMMLVLFLVVQGCGSGGGGSSYDTPATTETQTAITAGILKGWVDSGKVNGTGYDRVVILDVTTEGRYNSGHIPGALYLNRSDILPTRSEGVVYAPNMVLDGPSIDALVQKFGIDKNTTVVFTGSGSSFWDYMWIGRAYFNFRYWGFPKSRLKVLNGLNGAYNAEFALTTDATPAVASSTYSVRENPVFRSDLRVSLQEMIDVADGKVPNVLVIDGRRATNSSYDGTPMKTKGVFDSKSEVYSDICNMIKDYDPTYDCLESPTSNDYVAFEGHVRGAQAIWWGDLYEAVDADNDGTTDYYRFQPESEMVSLLTGIGLDSTKVAYVHCRTGMISSGMFVALDAYLGWPTSNWDGSWSQWGQLAGKENGGYLEDGSPWRTDVPERTEALTFNIDHGAKIENPADGGPVYSFDTSANKIEEEDKAYFESGGAGEGGGEDGGPIIGCG